MYDIIWIHINNVKRRRPMDEKKRSEEIIDMREPSDADIGPAHPIGWMFLFVVLLLLGEFGGAGIAMLLDIDYSLPSQTGVIAAAVIVCIIMKQKCGTVPKDVIRPKELDLLVFPALIAMGWSMSDIFDQITGSILVLFSERPPSDSSSEVTLITVLVTVILAPVSEELIFRFGCMGMIRKRVPAAVCILLPTIVFTLVHFPSPQIAVNIFINTVFSAIIYYFTENLIYTIVEHMVHNALCLLPLNDKFFMGEPIYYQSNGYNLCGSPWLIMMSAVFLISFMVFMRFIRKHNM